MSPSSMLGLRPAAASLVSRRAIGAGTVALLLTALLGPSLAAQTLPPKRAIPVATVEGCASPTAVGAALEPERAQQLLVDARDAALIGDRAVALALFAQAASADPGDPEIAYYRARLLEETGELPGAASEYCRFLSLAADSPDAAEVRERLSRLEPHLPAAVPALVAEQFHSGVTFLDRGDLPAADGAFSYVVRAAPDLAEAYYNRALVRLSSGRRDQARQDLEKYLALAPEAGDREAVLQQMDSLGRGSGNPTATLIGGLLLPGLGQYTTNRPAFGMLVTAAAGGAVLLSLQGRDVERTGVFLDPFNNPREYVYRDTEYPYRVSGLVAAALITAFGAAESYLYLRRTGREQASADAVARLSASFSGDRFALQLALPVR